MMTMGAAKASADINVSDYYPEPVLNHSGVKLGSPIATSSTMDEPVLVHKKEENYNNETKYIKDIVDNDENLVSVDNHKKNYIDYYSDDGELLFRINKKPKFNHFVSKKPNFINKKPKFISKKPKYSENNDDLVQKNSKKSLKKPNNKKKSTNESMFDKFVNFIKNMKKMVNFVIIPFFGGILVYFGKKVKV